MNHTTSICGGSRSKVVFRTNEKITPEPFKKSSPVPVMRQPVERFITAKQPRESAPVYTSSVWKPGLREFTNELCITSGIVRLSKIGMINLEVSIRVRNSPPDRIREYFQSYRGVRNQLKRCHALFGVKK